MIGRGTRLDPKTGKFSFQILDFVGLCKRMEDNGKGTLKENSKVVKAGKPKPKVAGPINPKGEYFLIDNADPAHLIQWVEIHGNTIVIKDNIPIEEAKRIFEEELNKSKEPVIVDLKEKAQQADYQPTEEELAKFIDHTLLAPEATSRDIAKLCQEANEMNVAAICCELREWSGMRRKG